MFVSVSLPICAIFFSFLLVLIYFSKKRVNLFENKLYSMMIILVLIDSIIVSILQLIPYMFKLSIINTIIILLNKIDFIILAIYCTCLIFYTLIITYEKIVKNKKKFLWFFGGVLLFVFLFIIIGSVDVIEYNGLYSVKGTSVLSVYLYAGITLISAIIIAIFNIRKKDKRYIPIISIAFLMILLMILFSINPYLILISITLTYINLIMYFTIENPDVKMLKQVELAKLEAERANSAKTDFLSSMSHEIRTPLNAIMGFSECIIKSNDLETAKEDAKDIVMASQNLLEIVNGILDISKIEAGKMELVETNYDLVQIGNDLAKLMIPRIGEKPIELKINFAKDIPGVLYGDGGKLKQVMTNILTNAVKYTEKGSITFDINCINDKNICKLIISVEDTGRGIKPEKINTLFNKFERLDEDKNTTLEGTGLGLAITKKMVEMLNGKIIVQSKYGIGSKFTVYLAQTIVSMQRQVVEEEKTEISTFDNKKILLVDDNTLNIKIAVRLLNEYNLNITSLDNGFSCIDKINSGEVYDLILLDDMMPKMSGTETLHKLKEIPNFNIPVVVLTANAIDGMKENYLKEGFNDYLSKPIEKHELTRVLNKFLLGSNSEVEDLDDLEFMNEEVIIIEDEETGSNTNNIDYLIENNIDVNTSLELLGDIEMYNETLDIFYDEINDKTSKMKEYKDSDNLKEYATLVHSIKSDSKYLGFTNLAKMSLDHELKAKENDSAYIKENYDNLITEINKIINIIKVYLNK